MKNKRIKVLLCVLGAVLLVLCISSYIAAVSIYNSCFNYRCTTSVEDSFSIEEFPELSRERHSFSSKQGHTLVGYLYEHADTVQSKGVIVFAHGLGGGGQRGYMDIFNYLASRGYYVFAYDATANDESEGELIGGLPQGIIDLDYAIDYAQTLEPIKNLPLVLMGYSWGGLSVGNVLNHHPEAKAVVTLAAWNASIDRIEYRGCQMAGDAARLLLPFVSAYEFFKYGRYAFDSAMEGFENTDCAVMVVHGEKDDIIPIEYGYETYYEKYADSERFVFKKYTDRDHSVIRGADGKHDMELMSEIVGFIDASLD